MLVLAWLGLLLSLSSLLLGVHVLVMRYRRGLPFVWWSAAPLVIGLVGCPFGVANVLRFG